MAKRKPTKQTRLQYFTWFSLGLFGIAAASQAKLQIVDQRATLDRALATKKFVLSRTEYARRGAIYSSDGRPMAVDQDTYELMVRFDKVPKSDAFFLDLSAATGIPASDFSQLSLSGETKKVWREPMSTAQSKEIGELKTKWRADGISLSRTGERTYPLGYAAACVVGAMADRKPLIGLELSQNKLLAGEKGLTVGLTDKTGAFLPMRMEGTTLAKRDGDNVTLTIDSDLQQQAANAVKQAVVKNNADSGIAIVYDPSTGDLLAMANYPSFDPTGGQAGGPKDARKSTKNPVTQSVLEPGSMFKVMTLAKGLDMGKVGLHDHVNCGGQLNYNASWHIRCDSHHGNRAHGDIDSTMAIAKSCNVSAATWALKIGYDPMVKYVEDLGLLKKSNMGMPYEVHGRFNYGEYAKPLQLMTVGFGQSLSTTPIALASAFALLANNGVRMQPRLIKKIGTQEIPPKPMGQIIRPATANLVMDVMKSVIQTDAGTGKDLRIPGYEMAGKTGTAQKIGKGEAKGYVSNFVGFVPANKPKAMILVMVDNPKSAYYGAIVAGPVFKLLAKAVIRRYHIPPTEALSEKDKLALEKRFDDTKTDDSEAPAKPADVKKKRSSKNMKGPEVEVSVKKK